MTCSSADYYKRTFTEAGALPALAIKRLLAAANVLLYQPISKIVAF